MRLLFKQRFFSWFDSYDIYDEDGNTVFTVEGKLAWGHCLHILNAMGDHIGTVQQRVLTFLPKFELYIGKLYYGFGNKASWAAQSHCLRLSFNDKLRATGELGSERQLHGVGLHDRQRLARLYRDDHEGVFSLDGHLRH